MQESRRVYTTNSQRCLKPADRKRINALMIAEDRRIAAMDKTEHFCSKANCAECDHNTQVQMARNRVAELH
jgi:hypothetical protein